MYVLSEDGRCIDKLPLFLSPNLIHLKGEKPFVISAADSHMAYFDTEADAKARLADVVCWLNAQEDFYSFNGEIVKPSNDGYTSAMIPGMKWVGKPHVYEFGKPIGYWKGVPA